jgi:hypothetical protein
MDENTDNDDTLSDGSEENDDIGLNSLVNEVWQENQSEFDEMAERLPEENPKLSRNEIGEEVSKIILPKERNLLLKKYKRILVLFALLHRSLLHRDIMQEVSSIMGKKDTDLQRVISYVLNAMKKEFNNLLEAGESNLKGGDDKNSNDSTMSFQPPPPPPPQLKSGFR